MLQTGDITCDGGGLFFINYHVFCIFDDQRKTGIVSEQGRFEKFSS
jgi:hypothetical protein